MREFPEGVVLSRQQLSMLWQIPDRSVRQEIQALRDKGVFIVGLPEGGYKLAETEEERSLLIAQYKSRMKSFAHTVKALEGARQIEGQMEL